MRFHRGWFGQSYRHYLASKGISTKRYFARDDLKGNPAPSGVKSAYALGLSEKEQLARSDELLQRGVFNPSDVSYLKRNLREKQKLSDVVQPMFTESVVEPTIAPTEQFDVQPLPAEPVPLTESLPGVSEPSAPFAETPQLAPSFEAPREETGLTARVVDGFADTGNDVSEPNTVLSPIPTPGTPGVSSLFEVK